MNDYNFGETLYENPLRCEDDIQGFIREGTPVTSFPQGRLRLENGLNDERLGQKANYLFWCPVLFPDNIAVSWTFRPLKEPGLAMVWFAATGKEGKDLFDTSLAPRDGQYKQYHSGDIHGYHISYFRRKNPSEREFQTCNMRKSCGFHLVTQGGDPLPGISDANIDYHMQVVKFGHRVSFSINELPIFTWIDDGVSYGPVLGAGRIGFRQMAPLIAEYADLRVRAVLPS